MKIIIFFITLSFGSLASARVFYVQDQAFNENASDMNPGTDMNYPWATWQKGFNTAMPGDTVYFRGGTWLPRTDDYGNVTIYHPSSGYGFHGTKSNPVCFIAYPPDVAEGNFPVLDCRFTHPSTINHVGLFISTTGYVEFKGLKVTNVRSWPSESGEMWCAGIMANGFRHLTLEQMTASYIGGAGFFLMGNDTLFLINCDSHHNCDSLDVELPGNDADGFILLDGSPESDTFKIAYIHGCRAWNNSDDGFEISNNKQLDVHDCWSWNNGDLEGDPNGFKFNYSHLKSTWKRKVHNCIAANNERAGFLDVNLHAEIGPFMEYLNNTTYRCGQGFGSSKGDVFDCSLHPASVIYRNNLSFASTGPYQASFRACDFGYPTYVVQDHNTWVQTGEDFYTEANPAYNATDDDFISLDTAQLRWARKADGSLPDITFMKLISDSDLINRGIDVGLAYYGAAPALGAFQYGSFSVELVTPVNFTEFFYGDPIIMQARVEGTPEEIKEIRFYTEKGNRVLGIGNQLAPFVWQYTWESDTVGYHDLRAEAFGSNSESALTSRVMVWIGYPLRDDGHAVSNSDSHCKIVPNPNNGVFKLELKDPLERSSDIHIISTMGQLVAVERMAQDERMKELDLSSLPPGFYTIRFESKDRPPPCNQTMKMVKN